MSQRPEILWPLFADLTGLPGVGPKTARMLERLDIRSPADLLLTLPTGGIDRRTMDSVLEAAPGQTATVEVEIGLHQPARRRGGTYRVFVRDARTEFLLVFFHAREDRLRKILPSGQRRVVSGRIEIFDGLVQMPHPDHILRREEAGALPRFEPVYPLTQGVTRRTMTRAVAGALERVPDLPEWIDPALKRERGWPDWRAALEAAHHPENAAALLPTAPARERLAYDEMLSHQLAFALARARFQRAAGRASEGDGRLRDRVRAALPYALTGAQERAVAELTADMASGLRMNRMLQGDVGAGKTLVALLAMLVAVEAGGQAALMAPTEILARQHLASLAPLAEPAGVRLDLLTGRDQGAARREKLARLAGGETDIVIGTHALFQQDVRFADLRLAVVDEQHRFGVRQRLGLKDKGLFCDMLVMTATPIPRSLHLTRHGDTDFSVLDEKPPGRQPVETALISAARTGDVVARLGTALAEGRRAYWICPLVEESDEVSYTAAEDRFARLCAAFGPEAVGLVHGQLPPNEKDAAMAAFAAGQTKVLVATTAVEVGVNVPEATIMVIEDAERFGLAQLHQLRGRVGRGADRSTCLLLYDAGLSETARARLEILRRVDDGFEIAEEDLRLRGHGDVLGVQQAGQLAFRIADAQAQAGLLRIAHRDARAMLGHDPDMSGARAEAARALLALTGRDDCATAFSGG